MRVGRTIDGPANPSQKSSRLPRDARTRPQAGASGRVGAMLSRRVCLPLAATDSSPTKFQVTSAEKAGSSRVASLDDDLTKWSCRGDGSFLSCCGARSCLFGGSLSAPTCGCARGLYKTEVIDHVEGGRGEQSCCGVFSNTIVGCWSPASCRPMWS